MITNSLDTLTSVREVCAETFRVSLDRTTPAIRFVEDMDADSLSVVQLALALEERFKSSVSDEEVQGLRTVGDMASFVAKRIGAHRECSETF